MKFPSYLALAVLTLAQVVSAAPQEKPVEKPAEKKAEPRTLKVKLNYTGTGTVDSKHPILLFVFDSPDFAQGSVMPMASKSGTAKDETVVFAELLTAPVYVVAAFDPTGNYDGQSGPPPSGASMGMYYKTPGTAEPIKIEPGETVTIELAFDDSFKMP